MKLFSAALFFLIEVSSFAQSIEVTHVAQEGSNLQVHYHFPDSTGTYTVSLHYSLDNGNTWLGPVSSVSGDVGKGIKPRSSSSIVWNVLADLEYLKGTAMRFKVKAQIDLHSEFEPELVFVQGGNFYMGSKKDAPDASVDEKPLHEVKLSSFFIGKYEVTYGEFKTFVNETGYQTDADKNGGSYIWNTTENKYEKKEGLNWKYDAQGQPRDIVEKRHPVIHVSWNDAQAYINWLNSKAGKSYRLPTEAEWEFAARGGNKSQGYLYSGSNSINLVAWYNENSGNGTHPVGEKQANELGIFDMTGNVWEWCQDWYGASYYAGRPDLDANPKGLTTGQYRVNRGGSVNTIPAICRVTIRVRDTPGNRRSTLGFRLVLSPR
jgi:sulfatase modifying factor 1